MIGVSLPAGIEVEDPRPIAEEAPYTFFLPHSEELAALRSGDCVKFIFHSAGNTDRRAERMWVVVDTIANGWIEGALDDEPTDMPLFKRGDRVRLPLTHAISTAFTQGVRPSMPERREFWDRCLADACVIRGRSHADYLYREAPQPKREGDSYRDSGWRIRGADTAIAEDETRGELPQFVALGVVLNADDRWLQLVDRRIGSAYRWDPVRGNYIELE